MTRQQIADFDFVDAVAQKIPLQPVALITSKQKSGAGFHLYAFESEQFLYRA